MNEKPVEKVRHLNNNNPRGLGSIHCDHPSLVNVELQSQRAKFSHPAGQTGDFSNRRPVTSTRKYLGPGVLLSALLPPN